MIEWICLAALCISLMWTIENVSVLAVVSMVTLVRNSSTSRLLNWSMELTSNYGNKHKGLIIIRQWVTCNHPSPLLEHFWLIELINSNNSLLASCRAVSSMWSPSNSIFHTPSHALSTVANKPYTIYDHWYYQHTIIIWSLIIIIINVWL